MKKRKKEPYLEWKEWNKEQRERERERDKRVILKGSRETREKGVERWFKSMHRRLGVIRLLINKTSSLSIFSPCVWQHGAGVFVACACITAGPRATRIVRVFAIPRADQVPLTVPRLNWIFPLTSAGAFPPWKLLRPRSAPSPSFTLFRFLFVARCSLLLSCESGISAPFFPPLSAYPNFPLFFSFIFSSLFLFLLLARSIVAVSRVASRGHFEAEWN